MPDPQPSTSWLDLTIEQLASIVETGEVPLNLSWDTLPAHPRFDRIFRVRNHPIKVAQILLEAKGGSISGAPKERIPSKGQTVTYKPALSPEYRERRLKMKEEELVLQRSKQKNQTIVYDKICQMETDIKTLKKLMKSMIDLLRELGAKARK